MSPPRKKDIPKSQPERYMRYDLKGDREAVRGLVYQLSDYIETHGGKATGTDISGDTETLHLYATVPGHFKLSPEKIGDLTKDTGVKAEVHPEYRPYTSKETRISVGTLFPVGGTLPQGAANDSMPSRNRHITISLTVESGNGRIASAIGNLEEEIEGVHGEILGGKFSPKKVDTEVSVPSDYSPSQSFLDRTRVAGFSLSLQY